ncbi:MAG: class I SAM-dependent methyltransferase [Candidatus Ozemobacteraceae bacterium]
MNQAPPPTPPALPIPNWGRDEHAAEYESFANDVFSPIYPWLRRDFETAMGKNLIGLHLLELGGGPGHMAAELLQAGIESLTEVDLSFDMLARARLRLNKLGTLSTRYRGCRGDACSLPFFDSSFDGVFSRGSVQFWSDLPKALDEIKRVLKPNGLAYLGGGYGVSIPSDIKESVMKLREEVDRTRGKPRIGHFDSRRLHELARDRGENAQLHTDTSGFWLSWRPHNT